MTDETGTDDLRADTLRRTAALVSAYVGGNAVSASQPQTLLADTFATLARLSGAAGPEEARQKPAVPILRSVTDDYIVSLEDGRKLTTLKRYLRTQHGMTPEEYRAKWGLPADYPMVAPAYARQRSETAKRVGLGRVAGKKAVPAAEEAQPSAAESSDGSD